MVVRCKAWRSLVKLLAAVVTVTLAVFILTQGGKTIGDVIIPNYIEGTIQLGKIFDLTETEKGSSNNHDIILNGRKGTTQIDETLEITEMGIDSSKSNTVQQAAIVSPREKQSVKAGSGQEAGKDLTSTQKAAIVSHKESHNVKMNSGSGVSTALLRIFVLTYKRADSLSRCLVSLNDAEYDGKKVEVEIHLDRGKNETVDNKTLEVANSFVFKHGRVTVRVKTHHVGVIGQWLWSWRVPEDNTLEIAVFVEDDITLSPYFARYLRRVHEKYDSYPGINGYALQAESCRHAQGAPKGRLQGPEGEVVFLYPVLGSWGFSPHTGQWRDFVRWFNKSSKQKDFVPSVPGLKPTSWYKSLRNKGRADSMWTMWHIHHAYSNKLHTVYNHLPEGKSFSFNWREAGEHFARSARGLQANLLDTWKEKDLQLPDRLMILDAKGENTGEIMTPSGVQ